ncbi:hypothetical protein [Gluconobacter cerinus]|uniref:hypothetical protein n=1 Tax=Gluconobacter cerinus TaxID=38307 RepID=UPI001B8C653D|nr:hypothetical protein [Gluconobacter cerinus]MBS1026522.1 hypothetical protein [Gluconobacter cerinus]
MARMTLAEIKARPSTIDWTRVNATTDSDIDLQARKVAPTWIFRGRLFRHPQPCGRPWLRDHARVNRFGSGEKLS